MLAVIYFIFFLRIMQKLSNILHPSRQNWTTEVCIFLQKEDNSLKYLSQLLSHLLLYPGLSQWKLLSTPYIIPPWEGGSPPGAPQAPPWLHGHILCWQNYLMAKFARDVAVILHVAANVAHIMTKSGQKFPCPKAVLLYFEKFF